jgi:predicted nucleotidyltransferase
MIKFEKLPEHIGERLEDVKKTLEGDDNIVFAYLFGGVAKGKITPLSDLDIAVYLRRTENLAEYKMQLFDSLTQVLGTFELDLVILNTAPVSLSGRILQDRQLLMDKEPFQRHAYESLTLREFFDFKIKEDAFFTRRFGVGR